MDQVRAFRLDAVIICEIDGVIAGSCHLSFFRRKKGSHRAAIGIAILKPYWNLGIVTVMFEEMIRIGREHGIKQLELEVMEGNICALGLYEKMGFQIVAAKPNAFCLDDGTMQKEFIMIKEL